MPMHHHLHSSGSQGNITLDLRTPGGKIIGCIIVIALIISLSCVVFSCLSTLFNKQIIDIVYNLANKNELLK
jgi:hypothetical protein